MIFNLGNGAAAPKLTSISVTTQPSTTLYDPNTAFQTAGMVVTASFDDGSSSAVTGYTCSPSTLTADTEAVTISYTHEGITKTTTVAVRVRRYLIQNGKALYTLHANGSSFAQNSANGTVDLTGAGNGYWAGYIKDINLSRYKTLKMTGSFTAHETCFLCVWNNNTSSPDKDNAAAKVAYSTTGGSLDVSSFNGIYSVGLTNVYIYTQHVKNLYLDY